MIDRLFTVQQSIGPFVNCVEVSFSDVIPKEIQEIIWMDLTLELVSSVTKQESVDRAEKLLVERLAGADQPDFTYNPKNKIPTKSELKRVGLGNKSLI
jgi:hypothetical protein